MTSLIFDLRTSAAAPIRFCIAAVVLLFVIVPETQARDSFDAPVRQMAITVDDLPASRIHVRSLAQQEALTVDIVGTLTRHGVPAVGFVNESKLEVDGRVSPDRVALLERWLDSGLELGNHGYAHLDLHRVAPERPISGYTGAGGISWLHRWAITEGVDPAVFHGEPHVPDWVKSCSAASGNTGGTTAAGCRPPLNQEGS